MKKIYNIIVIIFVLSLLSCFDDKGNYDYHEINEVEISGFQSRYNMLIDIDDLKIEPIIEMTDGDPNDTNRFKYFWFTIASYDDRDTLSTERNINYKIDLDPKNYTLYFKILDTKTEVIWKHSVPLTVSNPYAKGIMLIGENNSGVTEFQMISMVNDTVVTDNILENTDLPGLRNPIDVIHTGGNYSKLWVLTESGGYFIDKLNQTSSTADNFNSTIVTTEYIPDNLIPLDFVPRIKDYNGNTGNSSQRAVVCSNGYLFYSSLAMLGGDYYTSPVNRIQDDMQTMLFAKPYLFYALNDFQSVLWYDEGNERFLYAGNTLNNYSTVLRDGDNDPFPWDQKELGRTLVYGENTFNTDNSSVNGNSFALMKDNSGKYFIYKFYVSTGVTKRNAYEIKDIAVDFDKADFYTFSSNRSVIFYSVGSKLYAYDYNPGLERIYEMPGFGTDEITMLKFDTQIQPSSNPLYVATYNSSTGGTLQKYNIGMDPNKVEITADSKSKWSGLTKIKNMSWRASQ